jgi:hypothetical protein
MVAPVDGTPMEIPPFARAQGIGDETRLRAAQRRYAVLPVEEA